jgi:hypothetical protein
VNTAPDFGMLSGEIKMRKILTVISYLTLFGGLCGAAGLIATASGSKTTCATFGYITSETPEGFNLILIIIIWLSFLSIGCIYLSNKVNKLEIQKTHNKKNSE